MASRVRTALLALLAFLVCLQTVLGQDIQSSGSDDVETEGQDRYFAITNEDGETEYVSDNRRPSLYTADFGDCLGPSQVVVSRFDAAYYKDNMTVLFHFEGSSDFQNADVMLYIGVFAYGESRFDLTFNPCGANIESMCPLNSSMPITASGIIPVSMEDVSGIPPIALSIPDFEGEAILRIFANATQSEIGCYAAQLTNGNTFSHPKSVGTVLGIFTAIALFASFATAVYGEIVPTMRLHYAHSLSVGVVFAVFQHIFFTGALSVNWPSVLVSWWSNFAWSAGMIYSKSMQSSIDSLVGNSIGNTSQVGAATGTDQTDVAGGFDIQTLYTRDLTERPSNHLGFRDIASEIFNRDSSNMLRRDILSQNFEQALQRRQESGGSATIADSSDGFEWYGQPVESGLPLPGNYSGFAGTLGPQGIRVSNAFMTGFLWFLILLVIMVAVTMAFKWILEGFARFKIIKSDRLRFFRAHWLGYSGVVALRICYLGWFMMMFLTLFQFTYRSNAATNAIAAIVFVIFLVGIFGLAGYAIWYKYRQSPSGNESGRVKFERKKLLGVIPWAAVRKTEQPPAQEAFQPQESNEKRSFWRSMGSRGKETHIESEYENIHDNEDYTKRFGWLAARFRRSRWWFFAAYIGYEFVRAVFYAGASGYALAQVFGLLAIEFIAFCFIVWARPFEGRRLNILVVYCLGFSKVASVALSAAFDVRYGIDRIIATVIGVVIIVIQGVLTILTLIAIIVGAISSWMSISRNREEFKPRKWHGMREKYFNHLDRTVNDVPRPRKQKPAPEETEEEKAEKVGFNVTGMRRLNKIEDDDAEFASEMHPANDPHASYTSFNRTSGLYNHPTAPANASETGLGLSNDPSNRPSRANSRASRTGSVRSMSQTNLPYGARAHRPSWSTRDFSAAEVDTDTYAPVDMLRSVPDDPDTNPAAAAATTAGPSPSPTPTPSRRRPRTPSFGFSRPASDLRPQPSSDSLAVGGDVSTRDTIGRVPAPPAMRPRSNTGGSVRSAEGAVGGGYESGSNSRRNSRMGVNSVGGGYAMLTPALERDEWISPAPASRDGEAGR